MGRGEGGGARRGRLLGCVAGWVGLHPDLSCPTLFFLVLHCRQDGPYYAPVQLFHQPEPEPEPEHAPAWAPLEAATLPLAATRSPLAATPPAAPYTAPALLAQAPPFLPSPQPMLPSSPFPSPRPHTTGPGSMQHGTAHLGPRSPAADSCPSSENKSLALACVTANDCQLPHSLGACGGEGGQSPSAGRGGEARVLALSLEDDTTPRKVRGIVIQNNNRNIKFVSVH